MAYRRYDGEREEEEKAWLVGGSKIYATANSPIMCMSPAPSYGRPGPLHNVDSATPVLAAPGRCEPLGELQNVSLGIQEQLG
jgi:hypothetical protein